MRGRQRAPQRVFELVFDLGSQPRGFNSTPGAKKSTRGHERHIQLRSNSKLLTHMQTQTGSLPEADAQLE